MPKNESILKKSKGQANIKGQENAKGQAALEYLMTYGWAIAVVIAIIALLMFIARPQPIETCQIGQPFECVQGTQVVYKGTANLSFVLKNVGYEQITIAMTACGYNGTDYTNPEIINKNISVGGAFPMSFNCTGQIDPAARVGTDVFQKEVYMTYTQGSYGTPPKATTIRVAAKYSP